MFGNFTHYIFDQNSNSDIPTIYEKQREPKKIL